MGHQAGMVLWQLSLSDEGELWLLVSGARHILAIVPIPIWQSVGSFSRGSTTMGSPGSSLSWA